MTFAHNPAGDWTNQHLMSVNGKFKDFTEDDLLQVADMVGMVGAAQTIPVQRVGLPEDVANAISFFCSEAAGFVSGQILYIAGGPVS